MTDLPRPGSGASHSVREEAVELAALSWFDLVGWRTLPGDHLAPDGPIGARRDYRQCVLEPELRSALATLNPDATAAMVDTAVQAVLSVPSQELKENNRAFHTMLASGVPVEIVENGETRTVGLRLFDRQNLSANRWLVANQFVVQGEREIIRPDVTAFVNGLPLAVLELKSPVHEHATLESAWHQLQNYKAKAPELLRTNQVLVISDGLDARIGSLTAGLDRFGPWRTIEGDTLDDGSRPELEVLIRGVFAPERFLDFIVDFVAFEVVDGVVKSKKLAGYHQFHAVRKALVSTEHAAAEGGGRRGGVIWHTQGSGKSLTMLFFVRQLQLAKPLRNPTVVIVTDRNDLDDQLFGIFNHHISALRGTPRQANSAAEMRQLLAVDIGGLVFTGIQKFRGDEDGHPLLTDRRNVIVIADEAHRSQYGLRKRFVVDRNGVRETVGFAEYLRQALPNATFVGFTGTPIEEKDRNTQAVFGDVIDTYDMTQAVTDKATVPIHYTARLAKLRLELSENEREELDALAEELSEGDEAAVEHEKGKLGRFEEVVGAPDRIHEVARDIVAHFEARREALGGGKGMIVTISRRVAVELYNRIAVLRPDWVSADPRDDATGMLKVVITGKGNTDPELLQPHLRSKRQREELAERFKNPTSGFDLVIVRDMWLTGFDAPSLHTLYIDKPMRGHGLMQAIARVNRVWGDKPGGLVVDYLGVGTELREALAQYTERDRDQVRPDLDEAVRQTLLRLESAETLLEGVAWRRFFNASPGERLTVLKQCLEHLLSTQQRDRFVETSLEMEIAYAISAGDERVAVRRDEIAIMAAIRTNLVKYTKGGVRSRFDIERDIRQLLSRAVMSDGILDVFQSAGLERPDLSILSDEFLAEARSSRQPSLAVETLRRLLEGEIKARTSSNLVEARKLTDRLDETLRRYHNRAVDSLQVIEELIALAKELSAAKSRGEELALSEEELAFYDALAENGSARDLMAHDALRTLAQILTATIRSSVSIDWTRKESVRAKMRIEVRKLLARYGYPPDLQRAAVDLVIKQAELIAGSWR
ncbi:type I restriction endonuclease subunit R [Komagataeibacter medellinensis]|uniref:Type I restriction enzyme endonuclease subunit n=1 Tax=Komagataeibacter medellinensis (strain NBRC 3288 / BCRC 11682 / LMG 1693 / Kondo 51) TaxID=634177 RepID=G2I142_KOMMN|nr:type I restriction endonuclease subunit R [Komagataeibacter medellinensis]BAK84650.1 type I/III endonuclease restriction R subunit [Komagataeibacter medellinensis NBRC 3288]